MWYTPWLRNGIISVAGHKFNPRNFYCTEIKEGNQCKMCLNDLLSDVDQLKVTMEKVACYGGLNGSELDEIKKARAARDKSYESAF
jgi:hypothetical protein